MGRGSPPQSCLRQKQLYSAVRALDETFPDRFALSAAIWTFGRLNLLEVFGVERAFLPIDVAAEKALVDQFEDGVFDLLLRHLHFDRGAA
jgi:hypothetical protein